MNNTGSAWGIRVGQLIKLAEIERRWHVVLREVVGLSGVRWGGYGEKGAQFRLAELPMHPMVLILPRGARRHGDGLGLAEWVARAGREAVEVGDTERHMVGPLRPRGAGTAWGCAPRGWERRDTAGG